MRAPVRDRLRPSTSARQRRRDGDEGFSLVELLVVMTLMIVVLGLGTDAMASYIVDVRRHQERVDALHDLQLSAATVSRELRAADPLEGYTAVDCDSSRFPGHPAPVTSCANEVTVQVKRRGEVHRLRYALVTGSPGSRLELTTSTLVNGSWTTPTTSTVVRGLSNGTSPAVPVFALADVSGVPAGSASATGRIQLSLVRRVDVPRQPQVRLDTQVAVRNAVYRRARP